MTGTVSFILASGVVARLLARIVITNNLYILTSVPVDNHRRRMSGASADIARSSGG